MSNPMPGVLNIELFIKLMGMTTSSTDGEALAALRAANRALSASGGSWDVLLRGKLVPIDPFASLPEPPKQAARPAPRPYTPPPPPPPPRRSRGVDKREKKLITSWLVKCEFSSKLDSTIQRQIDVIQKDWDTHDALTDNQFNYLKHSATMA